MADVYTLSLAQIAQNRKAVGQDIAESTVRKYARMYQEYLPSRKYEGERWEKYADNADAIIGRIFTLSQEKKARHEIKAMLDAEGWTKTLDGETGESDATASDAAHPYTDTPEALPGPHTTDVATLQHQHGELLAGYNVTLARSALESLRLHRELLEEKDVQLKEMAALTRKLEAEKQAIKAKYQRELSKVLDQVVQWKARHVDDKVL